MSKLKCAIFLLVCLAFVPCHAKTVELLHVSFDPTRELFRDVNDRFAELWKKKTGDTVKIYQSHGGSGKQARSVIDGLKADIVSLALPYDVDAIVKNSNLIPATWRENNPHQSIPYFSTIHFLVRKGNPKNIQDWADLVRSDVSVITPNPKTSGGARWNYLAAWGYALRTFSGDEGKAKAYMAQLYKNVPVLDTGARAATITFLERDLGDVLIAWENESALAAQELGDDRFDVVIPSVSILTDLPVCVVQGNTDKKRTTEVARAYVSFLFSQEGQDLITRHHFRSLQDIQKKDPHYFSVSEMFGSWDEIQKKHFSDGGLFDQIYLKRR